jgi:hypothetical protein
MKIQGVQLKPFFSGLFLGSFLAGLLESVIYFYLRGSWDNPKIYVGYHVHHSILGVAVIILGIFFIKIKPHVFYFLVGLGLGIIILHTMTDGRLIFIEKI